MLKDFSYPDLCILYGMFSWGTVKFDQHSREIGNYCNVTNEGSDEPSESLACFKA